MAKSPLEDIEQELLARWLDCRPILWTHPPNGGHRHVRVGAKLKRMGTKGGVPDCLLFSVTPLLRAQGIVGVAIELKRIDGDKPTPEQLEWMTALEANGWKCGVGYGHKDAEEWLTSLGY